MVISKNPNKNTGKASEAEFEERLLEAYKKRVHIYRIVDAAEIVGRSKGKQTAAVPATPADYIITADGRMMYAEVKSTINRTSFDTSKITIGQKGAARKQAIANGEYFFFINCLPTNTWYQVPALFILDHEKKSIKWTELEQFKWTKNSLM